MEKKENIVSLSEFYSSIDPDLRDFIITTIGGIILSKYQAIGLAAGLYLNRDWKGEYPGGPNPSIGPFPEGPVSPPAPPDERPHCNPRLNLWNDAESAQETPPVHYDPLVLDLNRDGKINLDNATFFDLNASGFHEYTRWISETDAFLVLDVNGNGKIDNGSEMFGDSMRLPDGSIALSGFDALRSYDSNGDGKIDANDEIFSSLKLLTGAGQLVTLGDAGVKSINIPDRTRLPEFNASALPRDERIRQDYQRWLDGGITATKGSFSLAA